MDPHEHANDDHGGAAPTPGAAPAPAEVQARPLEERLRDAEAKIEEQREAFLRAAAEADNARKRAQAEIASAHKFAIERFAEGLLPVADSLEATLGAANASLESLRSGVELTLRQLRASLEKSNVNEICPAAGEKFDPRRHQAISTVESDAEPNTVASVLQKGWALHERVIRPALVTVTKAKAGEAGD